MGRNGPTSRRPRLGRRSFPAPTLAGFETRRPRRAGAHAGGDAAASEHWRMASAVFHARRQSGTLAELDLAFMRRLDPVAVADASSGRSTRDERPLHYSAGRLLKPSPVARRCRERVAFEPRRHGGGGARRGRRPTSPNRPPGGQPATPSSCAPPTWYAASSTTCCARRPAAVIAARFHATLDESS